MTHIRIDLDTEAATATDAAHLRALADVIDPRPAAAAPAPCAARCTTAPTPARFRHVIDRSGDHGILDTETDRVADFMARPEPVGAAPHARYTALLDQLKTLNAGTLAPDAIRWGDGDTGGPRWAKTSLAYPPYKEATAA